MASGSENADSSAEQADSSGCARLHLQVGWWSLLLFLALGVMLEGLHAFKVAAYLDVGNETRRLMWTLAHAHGTLLSVVNVVFAATVILLPNWAASSCTLASRCFLASLVLIPFGFFLGGTYIYEGDPGLGILLVPAGAVLLFVAVLLTARGARLYKSSTNLPADESKSE